MDSQAQPDNKWLLRTVDWLLTELDIDAQPYHIVDDLCKGRAGRMAKPRDAGFHVCVWTACGVSFQLRF